VAAAITTTTNATTPIKADYSYYSSSNEGIFFKNKAEDIEG